MLKKLISMATATLLFATGLSVVAAAPASASHECPCTLTVGAITGTAAAGTASTVTVTVSNTTTTPFVDNFQPRWSDAAGNIAGITAPTGITLPQSLALTQNTGTLTITIGSSAVAGTYYIRVSQYAMNFGNAYPVVVRALVVTSGAPALTAEQIAAAAAEAARVAAAAAEVERLAAIAAAKVELHALLKDGKPGTLAQYQGADYFPANEKTLARVNAGVLSSPITDRDNADKIKAIIKTENFIEQVSTESTQKSIKSLQLVEQKMIPATSRNKASVTNAVKNAPASTLSSLSNIQAVVDAEVASIKARKDRTAAIKAKIAAGNK
jgi:hypothetical protein